MQWLFCLLLLWPTSIAVAQGVSTSGIRGTIRAGSENEPGSAQVRVTHGATGFSAEVEARRGRFLVQGLEPGGPYTVTVRQIGFVPQRSEQIFLTLGELRETEFILQPTVVELSPTTVVASASSSSSRAHGGTAVAIGDSLLHGLPTLNRHVYDFVRLVPQISTKISLANPGFSAAGMGFRFNNFLIGGVSERTLGGNVSVGFSGAKSIPIDAVQEYQVLLSPYDVRYGDFTGALVNTVTKSGTNSLTGSAFVSGRNDRLARSSTDTGDVSYERVQYGFTVSGPIVRNRLNFLIAPELQHYVYPALGPYVGQPADARILVPVNESDLIRLGEILSEHGLTPGSAGPMQNGNPLRNLFSRVDLALPRWNSRMAVWHSYSGSEEVVFSRGNEFSLSSARATRMAATQLAATQLHTTIAGAGGGHNELLASIQSTGLESVPDVRQPIIRVLLPRVSGLGRETVNTGSPEIAHGTALKGFSFSLKDNFTASVGTNHIVTLGVEAEWFRLTRRGLQNSYGSWSFASLNDLVNGVADRYEVGIDFGAATRPLSGSQYAVHAGDRWQPSPRLAITAGVRADHLAPDVKPSYHPGVDSIFGRRTDQTLQRRIEVSPRIGFVLDLPGDGRRLRGGAGIFTSRIPLAWIHSALTSNGASGGVLRCGRSPGDLGLPPAFSARHDSPPQTCANGATLTENRRGDVNLLSDNLRMMRTARGSLAYDLGLPGATQFSIEAVLTRALSDFVFVNLKLTEPAGVDRNGRVMYGGLEPSGASSPTLRSGFSEVIDLVNEPHTRSYQLAARLEKDWTRNTTGIVSYTWSQVRDAQTPVRVNTRGTLAWSSARVVSGRHDDFTPGISSNDIPHRVVIAGIHAVPWRWKTTLSFYYVGESGRPFTYVASGTQRRGDLNADGANTNDPIYVPASAFDTGEIRFGETGDSLLTQQTAFEELIRNTSCLRRQRGRILERNSCREPWSNTTIASVRQAIPVFSQALEAQLDIFNVLNLLNAEWGHRREAVTALLEHVGETAPSGPSQSVFHFNPARSPWNSDPSTSSFQLQLGLRYRF